MFLKNLLFIYLFLCLVERAILEALIDLKGKIPTSDMAVKRRLKGNKMVTSRYKDGLKLWQQRRQAQKQ